MAAGANGPMKYVGLTRVQSNNQKPHHKPTHKRLTPSDADIWVCLSDFVDSLLSQSFRGRVNVERVIACKALFSRRGVPIYQTLVSMTI
jgi:hypothetical protein